jgi:hypothetical protein
MKIQSTLQLCAVILSITSYKATSQTLQQIEDSIMKSNTAKPAILPTWKDTRLINVQTTKTTAPGSMEFFIMHRFGNVSTQGGGGFHTFYGFDIASDILFAFEFGITRNFSLTFSRSKEQELLDISAKYRVLTQQVTGMPVSLALYGDAGITPEVNSQLYAFADSTIQPKFLDRFSYLGEMILDRRFNNLLSLELLAGDQHRNYILQNINPDNGAVDQNDLPFIAAGGRIILTKHASIVFDAYYIISSYRTNNTYSPHYIPISIGYEVETGGHVFEVNFTNASFLDENNIIPNTTDSWTNGGFKFGFTISRAFEMKHARS